MGKREEGARDAQVTLKIPRPLYDRLKTVIAGSGFHSVTEFAVYVLRDLVSHHQAGTTPPLSPGAGPAPFEQPHRQTGSGSPTQDEEVEPLSPEEIEAIRRRLTSLGYL